MKRAAIHAATGLLAAALCAACSAKDAAPAPTSFTLNFPSTAAAVAADTVDVQVFDASSLTSSDVCEDLISDVKSAEALPTRLADTSAVSTCSMFTKGAGTINVSTGPRAFLAIASHGSTQLLVGCAIEDVEGGQLLVPIDLALVSDTVPVPATSCTNLTDHCNSKC